MKIFYKKNRGYALIEVLIAITIISIVLMTVMSGVSTGIMAITGNKNQITAMIIAKNMLNEYQLKRMRGTDISDEQVKEYPGFTYSRETVRFEHELLGPIDAKKVDIVIKWSQANRKKSYSLSYIFPSK